MTAATQPAPFEAIVIGASAGGVDALSTLLPAIAAGYRGSVFAVLHLPRERPSLLVRIFAPKCLLDVREAEDKEPVMPGTLYFAPSDYHLLVEPGPSLALSMDEPVNFSRPSIDVLFESAADVYGPRLLGMILTGASDDGSAGLEAIVHAGGTAWVQDPSTAQVPRMVESALRRVRPQHVLGLDGLAAQLRLVTGDGPAGEMSRSPWHNA